MLTAQVCVMINTSRSYRIVIKYSQNKPKYVLEQNMCFWGWNKLERDQSRLARFEVPAKGCMSINSIFRELRKIYDRW